MSTLDLSRPLQYTAGFGKWSLIGPVYCDLDDQLVEVCKRFDQLSTAEREQFLGQPIHSTTCWTLIHFAERIAVFALRQRDPQLFLLGLRGFGLVSDRKDPRDIMTASALLIYVAEKLGFDRLQLAHEGWIAQPWMLKHYLHVAQRQLNGQWWLDSWGFRELETELGLGLISGFGHYRPTTDLVKLAMRVCRILEGDQFYDSSSLQLDQLEGTLKNKCCGLIAIKAHPNPAAHADMKSQLLLVRLIEFENSEQAEDYMRNYQRPSHEVGWVMGHNRLVLTLTARSWVFGVANVETPQSIQRFWRPMFSLIQNFDRYQWRIWQAYSSDGCISLTTKDQAARVLAESQLENPKLLYEFSAATGEEASTIHYERQGWEPYKPIGDPVACPNQCGCDYYPSGWGDCAVCGHLG